MARAERIARMLIQNPVKECVEWPGCLRSDGYGNGYHDGRHTTAHRLVWELVRGPVPDGLQLDHLCRNRRCVNPDHLEPVTHQENAHRGLASRLNYSVAETCPHGHVRGEVNSYVAPNGRMNCRPCNSAAVARSKARRTAERAA